MFCVVSACVIILQVVAGQVCEDTDHGLEKFYKKTNLFNVFPFKIMKIYPTLILFLLCLSYCTVCFSQTDGFYNHEKFSLNHYTDENGLPQNSIKHLGVDPDGFIWMATEEGLVRFDGQKFYTFDRTNLPLFSNNFFTLRPRMDREKGKGEGEKGQNNYRPRNRLEAGVDNTAAWLIENGTVVNDSVYLKKVFSFNQGDKNFKTTIAPSSVYNTQLSKHKIIPLVYDIPLKSVEGSFFECNAEKVIFYSHWKKQYEVPFKNSNRFNFFTQENKLYYFENDGKLSVITENSIKTKIITGDILHDPNFVAGKKNYHTYWNNSVDQTFLYLKKNLYQLYTGLNGEMTTTLILENFDFETTYIVSIYYDKNHLRLFLGSASQGLYVLTRKPFQVVKSSKPSVINVFYAQVPFDSASVVTPDGLILDNHKRMTPEKELSTLKTTNNGDRYSILTDSNGNIWAKSDSLIYQINKKTDSISKIYRISSQANMLYEGMDHTIWIGTFKGLNRIDPLKKISADKPQEYAALARQSFSLPATNGGVSFIMQQSPELLWIGTYKGLYKMFLKTGKKELIEGTENFYIRSIYISSDNNPEVYFTAAGQGFFLYQNGKLLKFSADRSGYLASAHCIVPDKKGFFWLPTNHGMFQISRQDLVAYARHPTELYYHYYNKNHGFHTNEFNGGCQPCSIRLDNGMLSLPSMDGLVWFVPEKINADVPSRILIADRYGVNGETSRIKNDTISLKLDPKQLIIYLTTPYFGNASNLYISYSLTTNSQPSDDSWTPLGMGEMIILLGDIKSGNYQLHIRKKNGFGLNNYSYKTIHIIVPLHWYETAWFILLCILAVPAIVFFYSWLRMRYLKRNNLILETAINIRTRELQETTIALKIVKERLLRQMHVQARLIASISHDVVTPLGFIKIASKRMGSLLRKKDYEMAEEMSIILDNTVGSVHALIQNLTNYIKTHVHEKNIKLEPVDVHTLIATKIDLFRVVINENMNHITNDIPYSFMVRSHAHLLGILIHNLMDNANKYTQDGQIRIYTIEYDDMVHLVISDTGPGMPEPLVTWLNMPKHETTENLMEISNDYQGLGLILIKEISLMLDIRMLVEVKDGTSVNLIFRKGEN